MVEQKTLTIILVILGVGSFGFVALDHFGEWGLISLKQEEDKNKEEPVILEETPPTNRRLFL